MVFASRVATTYDEILLRNFRAARAAAGLNHAQLGERMKNLGYAWNKGTVSKIERRERAFKAEEVPALACALNTSIKALMSTTQDDSSVAFPKEGEISASSVMKSLQGFNDRSVAWPKDGDNPGVVPVFSAGKSAWFAGDPDAPDAVKARWAEEDG